MRMLRMFVFPLNAMVAVYRVARGCRSDVSWNSGFPCSYLQTAYAFHYGLPTLEPARHPLCESLQKKGFSDEIITYEQNDEMLCGYSRCCCLYVLFCGSRLANNHGDTAWSAYMKGWQTYDTPNRQKQDASSAYIKANSVTGNHLIRAWALSFSNGDVGSDTVQFTTGQGRFISQYAYGWNGYKPRQIHLRLQNAGSYAGTTFAQGVWSPDSV